MSKGGRSVGLLTMQVSYFIALKSGNLSFLEPSGPVQAYLFIKYSYSLIQFYALRCITAAPCQYLYLSRTDTLFQL